MHLMGFNSVVSSRVSQLRSQYCTGPCFTNVPVRKLHWVVKNNKRSYFNYSWYQVFSKCASFCSIYLSLLYILSLLFSKSDTFSLLANPNKDMFYTSMLFYFVSHLWCNLISAEIEPPSTRIDMPYRVSTVAFNSDLPEIMPWIHCQWDNSAY